MNTIEFPSKNEDAPLVRVLITLKGKNTFDRDLQEAIARVWASCDERELDAARKALYSRLYAFYEDPIKTLLAEIRSLGGRVIHEIPSIGAVSAIIPANKLDLIRSCKIVDQIIKVPKVRVLMNVAAKAIYAHDFWNAGWNGSRYYDLVPGVEIAVVDTGISETTYLRGKIVDKRSFVMGETTADLYGHGTKVAHIIASMDSVYRGVAYGANLINAKALNKHGEGYLDDVIAAIEWASTQARDTAEIINLSLGTGEFAPDGKSEITMFVDRIAYIYKALVVVAAGNIAGGYTKINVPGDTFNGITVGAMDDRNTESRIDDVVWIGSCMGPTDDGRIKPDIVAPGASITTYTIGGTLESASGTSFATAIVSGAAALIYSYLSSKGHMSNLALATKAVIISSADFWNEEYPYRKTGFGYINLRNALQLIDNVLILNVSSGNRILFSFNTASSESFSVCLVWQRIPKADSKFYDVGTLRVSIFDPEGVLVYSRMETTNNVIKDTFRATKDGTHLLVIEKIYRSNEPVVDSVAIVSSKPLERPKILSITMPVRDAIFDNELPEVALKIRNDGSSVARNVTLVATIKNATPSIIRLNLSNIEAGEEVRVPLGMSFIREGIITISANVSCIIDDRELMISNGTTFWSLDDDTEPPKIMPAYVDVSVLGDKVIFEFRIQDDSGINVARLYWRIDYPLDKYSLDLADGVFNLTYDQRGGLWRLEVKTRSNWNGKAFYYVVEAIDADNDRPNDSLESYYSGRMTIRVKMEILLLMILIVIVSTYVIVDTLRSRMKVKT